MPVEAKTRYDIYLLEAKLFLKLECINILTYVNVARWLFKLTYQMY